MKFGYLLICFVFQIPSFLKHTSYFIDYSSDQSTLFNHSSLIEVGGGKDKEVMNKNIMMG